MPNISRKRSANGWATPSVTGKAKLSLWTPPTSQTKHDSEALRKTCTSSNGSPVSHQTRCSIDLPSMTQQRGHGLGPASLLGRQQMSTSMNTLVTSPTTRSKTSCAALEGEKPMNPRRRRSNGGNGVRIMRTTIQAAILFLVFAIPALAHHAFGSEFDPNRPLLLKGKIVKIEWVNPHAWIHMEVTNTDGSKDVW